jgi:hypothetical protein
MGGYRGLTQATVYLPTAPSGLEPEVFAFKERDVANYTTGQNFTFFRSIASEFGCQSRG